MSISVHGAYRGYLLRSLSPLAFISLGVVASTQTRLPEVVGSCVWRCGASMKKLLLASVASLVLAVPAMAADLGQPPVIAPVYNWTGFYFGGNGGYDWGNSSTKNTAIGLTPFSTSQSMNSWVAGGQLGFNWQFNKNWVLGAEADIQGTGQNSTATLPSLAIAGSFEQSVPFFHRAPAPGLPADG